MNQVYSSSNVVASISSSPYLGVQKQYHRATIRSLNAIEHVLT